MRSCAPRQMAVKDVTPPQQQAPRPPGALLALPQDYSKALPPDPPPAPPPPSPPEIPVAMPAPAPEPPPQQAPASRPVVTPTPSTRPVAAQPVSTAKPEKPSRHTSWKYLATPDDKGKREPSPAEQAAAQEKAAGKDIIHRARWAMPAEPLKTIYKDQEMIGTLRRSMNSDVPGIAICDLTLPLYDRFGYDQLIVDKKTAVILKQEGKLDFGASRIPVRVDQVIMPTGEVWEVKAVGEDAEGKTGLTGSVNNHYGKLILAAGINALLSLGSNALAGTPQGFYQNPAQQAARETSQSVSRDSRSITERQLHVPPTVEIAAGTPCLIQLDETVTFSRKPVLVQ